MHVQDKKQKMIKFANVAKKKLTAEADFFQQTNSNSDVNLGKYYLPNDLNHNKMREKNSTNFFYLNTFLLPYHFSQLDTLLELPKIKSNTIGITESRQKSNKDHLTNIIVPNYNLEH